MRRIVMLAAFCLLAAGCPTLPREYVEAQVERHNLYTSPKRAYPKGYLPSWIEEARAEGRLTDLEADTLLLGLDSWRLSNEAMLEDLE